MLKTEHIAKICLLFAWAVLPIAISWQIMYGPALVRSYLDESLKPAKVWAGHMAEKTEALVDTGQKYVDDNYDQTISTTKATAATVRHLDDFVVNLNANVNGGEDTEGIVKPGLIGDIHGLLVQTKAMLPPVQADVDLLAKSGDETLQGLRPIFTNVAALTATLDRQINDGSPHVVATVDALTKSLTDMDKILADEHIAKILANTDTTTYHLGEAATSVDLAFASLRQKFGLIKTILVKVFNMIKVTIPLP